MIVYCNFKPQSSTLPATWKCSQCGFTTHKKLQRPPSRRCESRDGKQDTQRRVLDYLACRQRGNVIATVNAATAGCGCSSTSADVYHCRHFNEPVLKRAAARCLEKIAAKVPGYTGRTCRDCKFKGAPPGKTTIKRTPQAKNVGDYLKDVIAELGIHPKRGCGCDALAAEMNRLGPDGCRRDRARLVEKLKVNAKRYTWGDVAMAAVNAVTTGLAWRIDLLDPYGSMLDEAIRRTENADKELNHADPN